MKKLRVKIYDQYDPISFGKLQPRESDCWENVGDDNPELTIIFNATTSTPSIPVALYCCEPYEVMKFYNGLDHNKQRLILTCQSDSVVGVYTYDKSLEGQHPKIKTINPSAGPWISEGDRKIYTKTKNLSMISSTKNFCSGHTKRLRTMSRLMELNCGFGLYGNAANNPIGGELDAKLESHRDYRFSIIIENEQIPGWHTEKILDCFLTGTVPIYWGDPSISDIFDVNGILQMDDFLDIDPQSWTRESFDVFSADLYESIIDSVKNNFDIALNNAKKYSLLENVNKICQEFMNEND